MEEDDDDDIYIYIYRERERERERVARGARLVIEQSLPEDSGRL
jgi:hypothetical protein